MVRIIKVRHLPLRRLLKRNDELLIVTLLFLPLFLICVLRPTSSTDLSAYMGYYQGFVDRQAVDVEPTFGLITWVTYAVGGSVETGFRLLLIVYGSLAYSLLVYLVYRSSSSMLFSVLVYSSMFYLLQMCVQMRSAVAGLIFVLALDDAAMKKMGAYYLKSVVAISFHTMAIPMLFLYPLFQLTGTTKRTLLLLPVVLVLLVEMTNQLLIAFVAQNRSLTAISIIAKLNVYLDTQQSLEFHFVNRVSILVLFVYYMAVSVYERLGTRERSYVVALAVSIGFYYLGKYIPVIGFRYPDFFNLVLICLLPNLGRYFRARSVYLIGCAFYMGLIIEKLSPVQVIASWYLK